jgi:magnesium chelatase family protein
LIQASDRISNRHLQQRCKVFLRQATDVLGFSARPYTKILKLARTIAYLEGTDQMARHHVSEAVKYRALDRGLEQMERPFATG